VTRGVTSPNNQNEAGDMLKSQRFINNVDNRTVERRNLLKWIGAGSLTGVSGCSGNSSSKESRGTISETASTLSGRVIDIKRNMVQDANIHIYTISESDEISRIAQTNTGSDGEWETQVDNEALSVENSSEGVVFVTKKSEWFDSKKYTRDSVISAIDNSEFIEQIIRRQFLLEKEPIILARAVPARRDTTLHYGSASVWRCFPLDEKNLQVVHVLLNAPPNSDWPPYYIDSGVLSIQIPENVSLNISEDNQPLANRAVIPISGQVYESDGSRYDTPIFASHIEAPRPLSPSVGHGYLSNEYQSPAELEPSVFEEIAGEIFIKMILGLGVRGINRPDIFSNVFETVSTLQDLSQKLSYGQLLTETIQRNKISDFNPNIHDTLTFGYSGNGSIGERRVIGSESISFGTCIDWEASKANQANITIRAVWNISRDPSGRAPDQSSVNPGLEFGATIGSNPSLPGVSGQNGGRASVSNIETFEDGDLSEYSGDTDAFTVQSQNTFNGNNALKAATRGGNLFHISRQGGFVNPSKVQAALRNDSPNKNNAKIRVSYWNKKFSPGRTYSGEAFNLIVHMNKNRIRVNGGSPYDRKEVMEAEGEEWYLIELDDIDWDRHTIGTLRVNGDSIEHSQVNGNQITPIEFANDVDSIDRVVIEANCASGGITAYMDDMTYIP